MLQKLPIGIQNFEKIREGNFVYVDKTEFVNRLISSGNYYFLSRPRRFGKSLLLSTFKAYFEGKRDLFEGLYISSVEKKWDKYPIFHLDLNTGSYDSYEGLCDVLSYHFSEWERQYGVERITDDLSLRFRNLITSVSRKTGSRVVILVDEYDKPLLYALDDDALQERFRQLLKAVYSVLNTCDEYIKFAFLTGVTKFSRVSIFSDLNNLQDISLDERYEAICGITSQEIKGVLMPYVEAFAEKDGLSKDKMLDNLREMYDGYHFSKELSVDIYNPFSLLNALDKQSLDNYWFESGTPSFLLTMLQNYNYHLQDFSDAEIVAQSLSGKENIANEPTALFYQTGYLTIKGFDKEFGNYRLGFPNREVEKSFMNYLLPQYMKVDENKSAFFVERFVNDLRTGAIDSFMERMKVMFAGTPYDLIKNLENHYQNVVFIVSKLLGYIVEAEYKTSNGRIDMMVRTKEYLYLFEFKFDRSAEEAINQINEKEYLLPFSLNDQVPIKIGVNFSSKTNNIEKYLVER